MSSIQFQLVDAFFKWTINGFKGNFDSYVDDSNPVKQAWKELFQTILLFVITLIVLNMV